MTEASANAALPEKDCGLGAACEEACPVQDPFVASEASLLRLQRQEGHRGPDKPLRHSPHREEEGGAQQVLPLSLNGGPVAKRRPPETGEQRYVAQGEERDYVIVDVLCWCSVRCLSLMKETHEKVYSSKIEGILWREHGSRAEPQRGGRGGQDG